MISVVSIIAVCQINAMQERARARIYLPAFYVYFTMWYKRTHCKALTTYDED